MRPNHSQSPERLRSLIFSSVDVDPDESFCGKFTGAWQLAVPILTGASAAHSLRLSISAGFIGPGSLDVGIWDNNSQNLPDSCLQRFEQIKIEVGSPDTLEDRFPLRVTNALTNRIVGESTPLWLVFSGDETVVVDLVDAKSDSVCGSYPAMGYQMLGRFANSYQWEVFAGDAGQTVPRFRLTGISARHDAKLKHLVHRPQKG